MKDVKLFRLILLFLLISTPCLSKEDIECSKKHSDFKLHCNFNKDIIITKVIFNGGECGETKVYRLVKKGYHWIAPDPSYCNYISSLTLVTNKGIIYKFAPL